MYDLFIVGLSVSFCCPEFLARAYSAQALVEQVMNIMGILAFWGTLVCFDMPGCGCALAIALYTFQSKTRSACNHVFILRSDLIVSDSSVAGAEVVSSV